MGKRCSSACLVEAGFDLLDIRSTLWRKHTSYSLKIGREDQRSGSREILSSFVMRPANGVAAASNSSSTDDADGVSSGKVISNVSGGEPIRELPLHLAEKNLRCTSPLESARLATVCKSWAAIVSERLAAGLVPHLFVCLQPEDKSDHRGVIVPVPLDGVARLPPAAIPARVRRADTSHLHCIGATPSGGLAFAYHWWRGGVVVFNPVTGASRSVNLGEPQHVLPASGGGDAFVSSTNDYKLKLSWKAGGCANNKWTHGTVVAPCVQATNYIRAAVNCNGRFYMLHKDGRKVSVVDVTTPPPLFMVTVPVPGLVDARLPYLRDGLCHMLESDGEVLFVKRVVEYRDIEPSLCCKHNRLDLVVVGFEVFRLDVKDRRWVRVERLAGDQALFVSEESSFAVRASETAGCRSNCIYFVRKTRYCGGCPIVSWHVWGAYSLEKQEVLFERPFIETTRCAAAMWFLPNVVV